MWFPMPFRFLNKANVATEYISCSIVFSVLSVSGMMGRHHFMWLRNLQLHQGLAPRVPTHFMAQTEPLKWRTGEVQCHRQFLSLLLNKNLTHLIVWLVARQRQRLMLKMAVRHWMCLSPWCIMMVTSTICLGQRVSLIQSADFSS